TEEVPLGEGRPQPDVTRPKIIVVVAEGRQTQRSDAQIGRTALQNLFQQRRAPYASIGDALKSSVEYSFEPGKLPKAAIPQPGAVLDPSGANLAAVLDVMQNSPDRSAFEALQNALHDAIPTLRGVVLPPAKQPAGAKALEFILSRNGRVPVTIPGALASG